MHQQQQQNPFVVHAVHQNGGNNNLNLNVGHVHHPQPAPLLAQLPPPFIHPQPAVVNGGGVHHSIHHGSSYVVGGASTSDALQLDAMEPRIWYDVDPAAPSDLRTSGFSLDIDADKHGVTREEERVARGIRDDDEYVAFFQARSTNGFCSNVEDDDSFTVPFPTPPSRSNPVFRAFSNIFRHILSWRWRRNYCPISHVDRRRRYSNEFPRSNEEDSQIPEVQQFRATQRLLNPNQNPPSSSQPPPPAPPPAQSVPMDVDDAAASGNDDNTQATATQGKKKRKTKKSAATQAKIRRTQQKARRSNQTQPASLISDLFATLGEALCSQRRERIDPNAHVPGPLTQPVAPIRERIANTDRQRSAQVSNADSVAAQPSNAASMTTQQTTDASATVQPSDVQPSTSSTSALPKPSTSAATAPQNPPIPPKINASPDVWEDDEGITHVIDFEISNSVPDRLNPNVIQIDDVDHVGGPDQHEYPPNEPDFRGVPIINNRILRNAIDVGRRSLERNEAYDEHMSGWHAAYIPHLAFTNFNQIAFLDPLFGRTPDHPIAGFLRMFPERPELIQCPLNVMNGRHWTLLSINRITNVATYYDPLNKTNAAADQQGETLSRIILAALEAEGIIEMNTDFVVAPSHTFNQQDDRYSCGYFVMLISEDIARYGHSIRHPNLNITAERQRINLILHRLYNINNERGAYARRVSIPDWPELPTRERVMSQQAARLLSQLPVGNSLIKKVNAKPITKKAPKQAVRRSDRIAAQPKVVDNDKLKAKIRHCQQKHIPIGCNSADIFPPEDNQGPMIKRCRFCNAYLFEGEESNKCCAEGTVPPPNNPRVPLEYVDLANKPEFMSNIRSYNSLFAMVSTSADMHMDDGVFKIQGEPRHNVGDLVPVPGQYIQFAQNYTIEADQAIENRQQDFRRLGYRGKEANSKEVIELIELMLRKYHPCVQELKTMKQKLEEYEAECQREGRQMQKLYIVWEDPQVAASGGTEKGRLNPPTLPGQVFSMFRSNDGGPMPNGIYFGVNSHGSNKLRQVPFYSGRVDAAAYPLIFLFGQAGWTPNIPKLDPNAPTVDQPSATPTPPPQPSSQQHPNTQPIQQVSTTQQAQPSSQQPPAPPTSQNQQPSTQQPSPPTAPQGLFAQASQLASAIVTQATQIATAVASQASHVASVIATQSTQVDTQDAQALDDDTEEEDEHDEDENMESENEQDAERHICDASSDEENSENKRKNVSQQQHYRAQLFDRTEDQKLRYNTVTGSRQLSQQFIIESYSKVEQQRLEYQESVIEQNKDRYDQNDKVRAYLQSEINKIPNLKGKDLGKVVMMPRKYRGGNRYMHHKFRSGIAINDRYGKDDLFITFTGNPMWTEIQENLRPGETWIDRPDLVCRVFNLKAREFINDITRRGVLGKVKAFKIALEHQKRGMPHLHILLTMEDGYKFKTAEAIDEIISAQLPQKPVPGEENYEEKLRYYEYVLKLMIHDPSRCGASCGKRRKDGKCGKGFGKDFCDRTVIKRDGYAQLCRPNDGRVIKIKKNKRLTVEIDNQWVVAHNRFLLLKYNCHINVEHCGGTKALKYLHKYLHKGHDRAFISVREAFKHQKQQTGDPNNTQASAAAAPNDTVDYNEIHQYRCLRMLGASEATERLYGMFITKQSHFVKELPVHLPDQHNVRFRENESAASVLSKTQQLGTQQRGSRPVSELTAFFDLVREAMDAEDFDANNTDPTAPQNLYYHQVYEHYYYCKKKWHKRKRHMKTLGRLQSVFPSNVELFCLRELLKTIKAPSCYADLLKCGAQSFTTFQECAVAHRLYVDDRLCFRTMDEVISYAMPRQCRRTFALILLYCKPVNAQAIWDKYQEQLLDRVGLGPHPLSFQERRRRAYAHVASILYHHRVTMADVGLPTVSDADILSAQYDTFSLISTDGDARYASMNLLQRHFTDAVLRSLDNVQDRKRDRLFFLQASGGCGKTYVFNTLTRILQANGYKVLVVASTGIAAILLDNGRTAHSAFRIPLDIEKDSSISRNHPIGKLIADADVIIWDEAPMQHKSVLERANKIVKELVRMDDHHSVFGNKTVILGGDFKQILPVVVKENVRASFESSILCADIFRKNFKLFELLENKRAEEDPEYAAWLQDIGSGLGASSTFGHHKVQLNEDMVEYREDAVIDFVYPPDIFEKELPEYINYVKDAALMAPLNEKVFDINDILIARLQGDSKVYTSVDTLPKAEYEGDEFLRKHYDTDDLNQFEHSSIPRHHITLRVRTVVMLTRNLDVNYGMCNGTRMVITKLFDHHIQCQLITGSHAGETVSIFPMPNIYNEPDEDWPAFSRFQLPIRTAFAITINKSQGQSLKKVGVLLESPCFAHGQLYVALSRVGNRNNIKIYVNHKDVGIINEGTPEERRIPHATNIVYPEVVQQLKFLTVKIPRITPPAPSQPSTLAIPAQLTQQQLHLSHPQTRLYSSAPPQVSSQLLPPPPKPTIRKKSPPPKEPDYNVLSEDSSEESDDEDDDSSLSSLPIDDGMFDEPQEITPSQINRAFLPDTARVVAVINDDDDDDDSASQIARVNQAEFDRVQAIIDADPSFWDNSFNYPSQRLDHPGNSYPRNSQQHASPQNLHPAVINDDNDDDSASQIARVNQAEFDRVQAIIDADPSFWDNSFNYPSQRLDHPGNSYPQHSQQHASPQNLHPDSSILETVFRPDNAARPPTQDPDDGITDAVAAAELERLNALLGQDDFDWEGQLDD